MSCEDIFDYNMMGPNPERAEQMTDASYDDAIQRYIDMAQPFFAPRLASEGGDTWGKHLAKQLREAEASLRNGILRFNLLDPDDADVSIAAFTLPFEIHYLEFAPALDEGDSEEEGYDNIEQFCSCDETEQRDEFVDAFYEYCVTAAAVAKEIGDSYAHRRFSRAIDLLDRNCTGNVRYMNDLGGMSQKDAETTFNLTLDGIMSLKTQMIIEDRRRLRIGLPPISKSAKADAPSSQSQTPPPAPDEPAELPATKSFVLGDWAKSVVFNVDAETQTITFRGNKGGAGETLSVPSGSAKAWDIVVRLLAASDKKGYIELRDEERYIWRKHFDRRAKMADGTTKLVNDDLKRLKMHIACAKGVGERGPTRIRLMRRTQSSPRK